MPQYREGMCTGISGAAFFTSIEYDITMSIQACGPQL